MKMASGGSIQSHEYMGGFVNFCSKNMIGFAVCACAIGPVSAAPVFQDNYVEFGTSLIQQSVDGVETNFTGAGIGFTLSFSPVEEIAFNIGQSNAIVSATVQGDEVFIDTTTKAFGATFYPVKDEKQAFGIFFDSLSASAQLDIAGTTVLDETASGTSFGVVYKAAMSGTSYMSLSLGIL